MTRIKAFLTHLLISAFVVGCFLLVTFFFWYPSPYFEADGALHVLALLGGVDLILGPILTLIVFKPGKPGLKFDLTVIVLVQLAALIYGGGIIYTQRPGYIVFAVDRFNIISANEVDISKSKYPELAVGIFSGPSFVFARRPQDQELREKILFDTVGGTGRDIEARPQLYELYENNREYVVKRAKPLTNLLEYSEVTREKVRAFLDDAGKPIARYGFVPLVGKNKDLTMIVDMDTGNTVGTINHDPWVAY